MKRCILSCLSLLLAVSSSLAQQTPPAPDTVFLWLAAGISTARIERLIAKSPVNSPAKSPAKNPDDAGNLSCNSTSRYASALQRAGADSQPSPTLVASLPRHEAISPPRVAILQDSHRLER